MFFIAAGPLNLDFTKHGRSLSHTGARVTVYDARAMTKNHSGGPDGRGGAEGAPAAVSGRSCRHFTGGCSCWRISIRKSTLLISRRFLEALWNKLMLILAAGI